MHRAALAVLALLVSSAAYAQAPAPEPENPPPAFPPVEFDPTLGSRVAETYVAPAAGDFVAATTALSDVVGALCTTPSAATLATARAAYAPVVSAWAAIWFLRFGPLVDDHRADRVFLWPDPRGIGLRQIQAFLADPATAAVTAPDLPGKSVALQGLPALDFILFGNGAAALATPDGAARCAAARAISGNVATIAGDIASAWAPGGGFASSFAAPGADNSTYRSAEEVAREALKAATNGLEFIRDGQLGPALGETPERANGRLAPLWRSEATYALLAAEIDALRAFLAATRFVDLLPPAQKWLGPSIDFELRAASSAISRIAVEPERAFADTDARATLAYVSIALQSVRVNVVNLAAALGLGTGFAAAEGGD